jgi:hypothetical protein
MGLNTSVQQFVERLNDLSHYLLYLPEEIPKQLDQDEIIEILIKSRFGFLSDMKQAVVNTIIDIFRKSYGESVSYFKRLENLEKIRHTNSPNIASLPLDNMNT